MPRTTTAAPTDLTASESDGAPRRRGGTPDRRHRALPHLLAELWPGLLLSLVIGMLTVALGRTVPAASPALVAILLGAVLANTGRMPTALDPGLQFSARTVLRAGIVLLGLQLALGDVLALGPVVIAAIVAVVGIGIGCGLLLGRLLRLPFDLTVLIACGFSICGAAAVAGVSGVLSSADRAQDPEQEAHRETRTATAVALVVVFGTLMIPLMPLLARLLELPAPTAGIWTGLSVLEVAQVVAVGSLIGDPALGAAVVVKLGRVLMLAPVVALLSLSLRRTPARTGGSADAQGRGRGTHVPLVPGFVAGFLIAVAIRSTGLVPPALLDVAKLMQAVLLAAAMFALGTGVRVALLRTMGARPVALASALLLVVTGVGLACAVLAG